MKKSRDPGDVQKTYLVTYHTNEILHRKVNIMHTPKLKAPALYIPRHSPVILKYKNICICNRSYLLLIYNHT